MRRSDATTAAGPMLMNHDRARLNAPRTPTASAGAPAGNSTGNGSGPGASAPAVPGNAAPAASAPRPASSTPVARPSAATPRTGSDGTGEHRAGARTSGTGGVALPRRSATHGPPLSSRVRRARGRTAHSTVPSAASGTASGTAPGIAPSIAPSTAPSTAQSAPTAPSVGRPDRSVAPRRPCRRRVGGTLGASSLRRRALANLPPTGRRKSPTVPRADASVRDNRPAPLRRATERRADRLGRDAGAWACAPSPPAPPVPPFRLRGTRAAAPHDRFGAPVATRRPPDRRCDPARSGDPPAGGRRIGNVDRALALRRTVRFGPAHRCDLGAISRPSRFSRPSRRSRPRRRRQLAVVGHAAGADPGGDRGGRCAALAGTRGVVGAGTARDAVGSERPRRSTPRRPPRRCSAAPTRPLLLPAAAASSATSAAPSQPQSAEPRGRASTGGGIGRTELRDRRSPRARAAGRPAGLGLATVRRFGYGHRGLRNDGEIRPAISIQRLAADRRQPRPGLPALPAAGRRPAAARADAPVRRATTPRVRRARVARPVVATTPTTMPATAPTTPNRGRTAPRLPTSGRGPVAHRHLAGDAHAGLRRHSPVTATTRRRLDGTRVGIAAAAPEPIRRVTADGAQPPTSTAWPARPTARSRPRARRPCAGSPQSACPTCSARPARRACAAAPPSAPARRPMSTRAPASPAGSARASRSSRPQSQDRRPSPPAPCRTARGCGRPHRHARPCAAAPGPGTALQRHGAAARPHGPGATSTARRRPSVSVLSAPACLQHPPVSSARRQCSRRSAGQPCAAAVARTQCTRSYCPHRRRSASVRRPCPARSCRRRARRDRTATPSPPGRATHARRNDRRRRPTRPASPQSTAHLFQAAGWPARRRPVRRTSDTPTSGGSSVSTPGKLHRPPHASARTPSAAPRPQVDIDEIVERVIDKIEQRVVDELERRGRYNSAERSDARAGKGLPRGRAQEPDLVPVQPRDDHRRAAEHLGRQREARDGTSPSCASSAHTTAGSTSTWSSTPPPTAPPSRTYTNQLMKLMDVDYTLPGADETSRQRPSADGVLPLGRLPLVPVGRLQRGAEASPTSPRPASRCAPTRTSSCTSSRRPTRSPSRTRPRARRGRTACTGCSPARRSTASRRATTATRPAGASSPARTASRTRWRCVRARCCRSRAGTAPDDQRRSTDRTIDLADITVNGSRAVRRDVDDAGVDAGQPRAEHDRPRTMLRFVDIGYTAVRAHDLRARRRR